MRSIFSLAFVAALASTVTSTPIDGAGKVARAGTTTSLVPPPPDPSDLPCADGGVLVLVARGTDDTYPETPTPTSV